MNGRNQTGRRHERGSALVVSILILLLFATMALSLVRTTTTQDKVDSYVSRHTRATGIAEAGIAEALSRLRQGDIPDDRNPRHVSQILLAAADGLPVLGPDSTALATQQPEGAWMDYSTSRPSSNALTVRYLTDGPGRFICRYDGMQNPAIQTESGAPIFEVTATGSVGKTTSRLVAHVVRQPLEPALAAALTVGVRTELRGPSVVVNGMNHGANTPTGSGSAGADSANYAGGDNITGAWGTNQVRLEGGATALGSTPVRRDQAGFPDGPWSVLGMTRKQWNSMAGAPVVRAPARPDGIVSLDDDGVAQDRAGAWSLDSFEGSGVLYVDGDLTLNGNVTWRGLIYVEGNLTVKGSAWVLGGVVVRGRDDFRVAGSDLTVLYSRDAIVDAVGSRNPFTVIAWRQLK